MQTSGFVSQAGGGLPPPSCNTKPPFSGGLLGRGSLQTCLPCDTADVSAVSHSRQCLLCDTADMSAVSHSRHVRCVTQQTCLLCHTADKSSVSHSRMSLKSNYFFSGLHQQPRTNIRVCEVSLRRFFWLPDWTIKIESKCVCICVCICIFLCICICICVYKIYWAPSLQLWIQTQPKGLIILYSSGLSNSELLA